jgi:hypothetical protein
MFWTATVTAGRRSDWAMAMRGRAAAAASPRAARRGSVGMGRNLVPLAMVAGITWDAMA